MPSSNNSAGPRVAISARIFTLQDQHGFALCSGDYNPVHLDPVLARRELSGAVVVHGMHLLLWMLDSYGAVLARRGSQHIRPVQLQCSFRTPVYLDLPVEIQVVSEEESRAKLVAVQDGQVAVKCSVAWDASTAADCPAPVMPRPKPWNRQAIDVPFDELSGKQGATPIEIDADEISRHFSHLAQLSGWAWVGDLLAITRIVGMESPGLHSMLSAIDLASEGEATPSSLSYRVEETDPRMGLVTMRVTGSTLAGSVVAFYRPGPVLQAGYDQVIKRVRPGEFSNQRALVVGGSRGIGEATAKLIAAGGGEVWLTYHTGKDDAQAVCKEIVRGGGHCRFTCYRTGRAEADLDFLEQAGFVPTQVYYFATPRVAKVRRALFNQNLFMAYSEIYVAGFAEMHAACAKRWKPPMAFFYPSSVVVQDNPLDLLEYSRAKVSGEALCASLNITHPRYRIRVDRLPVMATELSRGLIETLVPNAVDVMLPILRAMPSDHVPTHEETR